MGNKHHEIFHDDEGDGDGGDDTNMLVLIILMVMMLIINLQPPHHPWLHQRPQQTRCRYWTKLKSYPENAKKKNEFESENEKNELTPPLSLLPSPYLPLLVDLQNKNVKTKAKSSSGLQISKIFQTKKVKIPSDLQISVRFQPKTFRIVRVIVRYNFLFPINTLIWRATALQSYENAKL